MCNVTHQKTEGENLILSNFSLRTLPHPTKVGSPLDRWGQVFVLFLNIPINPNLLKKHRLKNGAMIIYANSGCSNISILNCVRSA